MMVREKRRCNGYMLFNYGGNYEYYIKLEKKIKKTEYAKVLGKYT